MPGDNSVTNAANIDAHLSGGLWMQGEDSNFNGINGDVIIGSATHANLIAGSVANDVLTGGTGGDTIITEGAPTQSPLVRGRIRLPSISMMGWLVKTPTELLWVRMSVSAVRLLTVTT